jgi:hypothetical protein
MAQVANFQIQICRNCSFPNVFRDFHSRTIHLEVIKVFHLPTDAHDNCFKKNIKI